MISPQEKELILQGAISSYIFDYCFSQANKGKVFDYSLWEKAVDKATEDPMLSISPDKIAEFQKIAYDLNKYAVDPKDLGKSESTEKFTLV